MIPQKIPRPTATVMKNCQMARRVCLFISSPSSFAASFSSERASCVKYIIAQLIIVFVAGIALTLLIVRSLRKLREQRLPISYAIYALSITWLALIVVCVVTASAATGIAWRLFFSGDEMP